MSQSVLVSQCRDPRWNLAAEEHLIEKRKPLLFLWRNGPSVILGRNQNPFAECSPELLQKDGVFLVRRKSGGGAVYHDGGNLNITMVCKSCPQALQNNFRFLQKALGSLGLEAKHSGRNDLEIDGKKISGSAFYEKDGMLCHHCTMLVDVNREAMARYLTPPALKLQAKGIASVRSRVVNLRDLKPELTVELLQKTLIQRAGGRECLLSLSEMQQDPDICRKAQQYSAWDWTYGESPESNLTLEKKFSWGLVTAELLVTDGKIQNCRISTDSLISEGFEALSRDLQGLAFRRESLEPVLDGVKEPEIRRDLKNLFCTPESL